MKLKIEEWAANGQGLNGIKGWTQWSDNLEWPSDGKQAVDLIPAMMRRRMSNVSKLAVQTAIKLLSSHEIDYLVFSSRHGELHRSVQLIDDILKGDEASPMAFSQSVHNTAAGLATIATKQTIPFTSIAAAENTFQSAILEAWLYLVENPSHKVLLVDFDEPLPEVYSQYEDKDFQGYALGLVISSGDEFEVTACEMTENTQSSLPQALQFLRHYLRNKEISEWEINSNNQAWRWQSCYSN